MKEILDKIYRSLIAPVKAFPGVFLFIGLLLFIPEVVMNSRAGVIPFMRDAVKYFFEHVCNTFAFSYAISWMVCTICLVIKRFFSSLGGILSILLLVVVNIYAFSSIWLYREFGISDLYTSLELLFQTNPQEASEFVSTYIMTWPFAMFLMVVFLIVAVETVILFWKKSGYSICRFILRHGIALLLFVWAMPMLGKKAYSMYDFDLKFFDDEGSICNTANNILWHDLTIFKSLSYTGMNEVNYEKMLYNTRVDSCSFLSQNIVLILGESFNRAHSSLYGYPLNTNPELERRHPYIFSNVISSSNATHEVVRLLFSLYQVDSGSKWVEMPLIFPIFRQAGYTVFFNSNQFIHEEHPKNWDLMDNLLFNNPIVEENSFDVRNTDRYAFDGDFIQHVIDIRDSVRLDGPALSIIHLLGQHVSPKDRFPISETKFSVKDIHRPELSSEQLQYIADYDNAVLYGDKEIARIIDAYEDEDAVIIFLSDHGDEVNDCRAREGRSYDVETMPPAAMHCQFDVPFMIFMTEKYRESHPEVVRRVENAVDSPYMTDALPHLLLYLAGIHTEWYMPEMNLLEDSYNAGRKRILYGKGTDYDSRCTIDDKVIGF